MELVEEALASSAVLSGVLAAPKMANAVAPANSVAMDGPGSVSPDGSCGGDNKFVCDGSTFGGCCSLQGWCGNSTAHCGNDCLPDFGTCGPPSNITANGQCGSNGKICPGSGFGDCCSSTGWCGDKEDFCGAGCQNGFGNCTLTDAGNVSTDGSCGKNGKICKGSSWGDCCSADGYCGKGDGFCSAGCQSKFGDCDAETNISTDGHCGKNGKTCKGSTYGDCCSEQGYCGKTNHCEAGCQSEFGTCNADSGKVSTDGRCGGFNGKTCKGSSFGDCCSIGDWCGKTSHCDAGCQSKFGTCNSEASNISTDGYCGKNGKTCKGSTYGDCCSAQGYCAVVRTERLVRAVSMATAVLSTDTVEREMISVARDVSLPTAFAPVFLPTLSVVPGTVELVLALALETVVLPMVTVEAQDLTVDRAARRVPPVLV
ncbi:hypothetical protein SNK03_010615 [Fusarium graminearum]